MRVWRALTTTPYPRQRSFRFGYATRVRCKRDVNVSSRWGFRPDVVVHVHVRPCLEAVALSRVRGTLRLAGSAESSAYLSPD